MTNSVPLLQMFFEYSPEEPLRAVLEQAAVCRAEISREERRISLEVCFDRYVPAQDLQALSEGLQARYESFTREEMERLRDEGTLIDGKFYLYGRPDAHRPGRGIETRKTPNEITADMDKDKPIIVLDHQPKELRELADAGVDLDLCGHTHDGQMFPGNLIIKLMWENACGYLQKGQMHNIVTSGVGVFGPDMRVGTKAEICPIIVHFAKD